MLVVDLPVKPPGTCFVCSSNPDGPWIDTLIDFDPGVFTVFNGRKYICSLCVSRMAEISGYLAPPTEENLQAEKSAKVQLAELVRRVQGLAEDLPTTPKRGRPRKEKE